MTHQHEPHGTEIVLERRETDDYTMTLAFCLCGARMTRETAPLGAKYNWEDWKISA